MEINRKGNTQEFKMGHYYLSYTEWDDGHCEIEIHECKPTLLWHSCDKSKLSEAKDALRSLATNRPLEKAIALPSMYESEALTIEKE